MTQRYVDREAGSRPEGQSAAPSCVLVPGPLATEEGFTANFERCFGRVYAYVSRRVQGRERCERIVSEVLGANLALLVARADERHEIAALKWASDRLIGSHFATCVATRSGHRDSTASPSKESKGTGEPPCPSLLGSSSV